MSSKRKLNPWEHLIAGTSAGLISTFSLFPLDTIKVNLMVDETTSLTSPKRIMSAIRRIIQTEGWKGLYHGLSPGLYGAGLAWGGYFFFYEQAKGRWLGNEKSASSLHHTAAACEAGIIMVGLTNPIWLVKTRMQLQNQTVSVDVSLGRKPIKPYKNFSDAISTIVKEEGVLALYKGAVPALLLVSHGTVQFVVYERLKMESEKLFEGQANSAHYLIMGAVAKIVGSISTYPLQVVKTRLQQREIQLAEAQADVTLAVGARYKGVIDCVQRTWRHEGIYGFYKGCLPNTLRVAPGAAITFYSYETIADSLRKLKLF